MSDLNLAYDSSLVSPRFQLHWTAGESLRQPHRSPRWTRLNYWVILCPNGGRYRGELSSGERLDARGRDLLLIPPRREYTLSLIEPGFIWGTGISFLLLGILDVSRFRQFPLCLKETEGNYLRSALERLCRIHARGVASTRFTEGMEHRIELESAGYALYASLMKRAVATGADGEAELLSSPDLHRLLPLLDHMERHRKEAMTRGEMAEYMNLSPQRLHTLFKGSLGLSPGEYLRRLRLEGARQSLDDRSKTVAQVASEFNYCDPYHFSKQFKARYGLSPRDYRRREDKKKLLGPS